MPVFWITRSYLLLFPSLIFWDSPSYIFVLDGGHRLSALRSWIEDDYGDKKISEDFYKGQEISAEQRRVALRTRRAVESEVGRYSDLVKLVDSPNSDTPSKRAKVLFKRALLLQWVHGSPSVAESSFYKINSQGTPLDDTERMLIENRKKPIAIASRMVLRSATGHEYWSSFTSTTAKQKSVEYGKTVHDLLFEPESDEPLKTVDVPTGGSVSPVEALSLLIDFLTIAGNREQIQKAISQYDDDITSDSTAFVLMNAKDVLTRVTGHYLGSLGLHSAVYFYNDKGKHSRFLFLGIVALVTEKLRNNDDLFFKKFTKARPRIEKFLIENKSVLGIILQNLGKYQRIPRMKDMFDFLVSEGMTREDIDLESVIARLGMKGRIVDVRAIQTSPRITNETGDALMVRASIESAKPCPFVADCLK